MQAREGMPLTLCRPRSNLVTTWTAGLKVLGSIYQGSPFWGDPIFDPRP